MKKLLGYTTLALAAIQIVLILISWMITAAWPELPVRSLLSSEGIRWFFGAFIYNLDNTILFWLILLSVACGVFHKSGLFLLLKDGFLHYKTFSFSKLHYRQKIALIITGIITIVYATVVILLTLIPHAILLSVLGKLFPSSFSTSIIPIIAFYILSCSLCYGYVTRSIPNTTDLYESLVHGPRAAAIVIPLYIVACQVIASIYFILGVIP